MKKEELEQYMNLGYSSYKIAKLTNKAQTTIRYWIKKYQLIKFKLDDLTERKCPKCEEIKSLDNFYKNKSRKENSYHSYCKSCNNNQVTERQRALKQKCIDYLGGKCKICNYNKYNGALQFHHLDPKQKEFAIGQKNLSQFENLISELNKCILLCANCHSEIHKTE